MTAMARHAGPPRERGHGAHRKARTPLRYRIGLRLRRRGDQDGQDLASGIAPDPLLHPERVQIAPVLGDARWQDPQGTGSGHPRPPRAGAYVAAPVPPQPFGPHPYAAT